MRSQRFIAFFLVLITVLSTTAFNFPLVGKFQRNVDHHVVDTVLADSIFSNADTLPSEDVTEEVELSGETLNNIMSLFKTYLEQHDTPLNKDELYASFTELYNSYKEQS